MSTPVPLPAALVPDASAGVLALSAVREEAARVGRVAVAVHLWRGTWTVTLDTLTAPDHEIAEADARAVAGAVRALVRAKVAGAGSHGPWQYTLERVRAEADARALAAAMHAAVYGHPAELGALCARLCAKATPSRD